MIKRSRTICRQVRLFYQCVLPDKPDDKKKKKKNEHVHAKIVAKASAYSACLAESAQSFQYMDLALMDIHIVDSRLD